MKKIFPIVIIFFIGSLGGIFGDRILFPYLAGRAPFSEIQFIREAGRGTTIINRKEEVVIRENERLSEVVSKVSPVVVGVRSVSGNTIYQGSGFILTGDGLVVTSNDLLLSRGLHEVVRGETRFTATVEKRDSARGVAILRIDAGNLPVVTFREDDLRLGELIFLLGAQISKDTLVPYVETGIVRKKEQDSFETTIDRLLFAASGSPMFDLEQKVVGMTLVRSGVVSVVPVEAVKKVMELIGL